MEEIKEIMAMIGSYGFPICITIYLLYERASITKDLSKVIENNTRELSLLIEFVKGGKND